MKRSIFVSAVVAILASCGGSPMGTPVPFSDYPTRTAQSICTIFLECCSDPELAAIFAMRPGGPPMNVAAYFGPQLAMGAATLQPSIDSGRIVYDADAAGDCFAELDASSCSELPILVRTLSTGMQLPGRCSVVLNGTVAPGDPCTTSPDCTSRYCAGGTCANIPGDGETCTSACAPGLFCDSGMGSSRCRALLANGEACAGTSACSSGNCEGGFCAAPPMACVGR